MNGASVAKAGTFATFKSQHFRDITDITRSAYPVRQAWRLAFHEMFDRLELKTTALINSAIITRCPALAEACRDLIDEIAAHGRTNAQAEGHMSKDEERE